MQLNRNREQFRYELLESRDLLAISLAEIQTVRGIEGETVQLRQLEFFDTSPDSEYSVQIDWGDGSRDEAVVDLNSQTASQLKVRIDYRYDTLRFFDTAEKKRTLQAAADAIANQFQDELTAISSSGGNRFTAVFDNPATGQEIWIDDFSVGRNEIVVFAGGYDLPGTILARAGAGGYRANGTRLFVENVESRGQEGAPTTDFSLWGGHVTFDTETNWHTSESVVGLRQSQYDLFTVAMHELMHVFGFNIAAPAFERHVAVGRFSGPSTIAEFDTNGSPRLNGPDFSHFVDGTRDNGQEVAMTPTIYPGLRKTLTALDLAVLDDVGWELIPEQAIGTFSASHNYQENGTYHVQVVISDSGEEFSDFLTIQVSNQAPTVQLTEVVPSEAGSATRVDAIFADMGSLDTHTASVDWGDGNESLAQISSNANSATASHVYSAPGQYTITFNVVDDDGGIGQANTRVTIDSSLSPVAANDFAQVEQGLSVQIPILENDTFPTVAADQTSVRLLPLDNRASITENGSVTYDAVEGIVNVTADSDFSGAIEFQYSVRDQNGTESNLARVTIEVTRATESGWKNQVNRLDVNDDGTVTAIDVLLIINELNTPFYSQQSGELASFKPKSAGFFDVNGDKFITALDALMIINELNKDVPS